MLTIYGWKIARVTNQKFLFNEKIDVVYTNYYKMTENNYSKINKKLYSGYCKKRSYSKLFKWQTFNRMANIND